MEESIMLKNIHFRVKKGLQIISAFKVLNLLRAFGRNRLFRLFSTFCIKIFYRVCENEIKGGSSWQNSLKKGIKGIDRFVIFHNF